jgi:hypothetical protein
MKRKTHPDPSNSQIMFAFSMLCACKQELREGLNELSFLSKVITQGNALKSVLEGFEIIKVKPYEP